MAPTYTTVKGDTLGAIAQRNSTDVATLAKLNGIADPNKIGIGQVLNLPGVNTGGAAPTPTLTPTTPITSAVLASGGKSVDIPPPVSSSAAQNALAVQGAKVTNVTPPAPVTAPAITSITQVNNAKTTADYLRTLIGVQGTKGDFVAQQQKEQDLAGKTQALADLNAKALTTKRAYEQQIKEMRKNPEGKLTGALDSEISDLTRKANEDLANIGIQQQVAQGNITAAKQIIEDKVNAKFEPIDNQIKSLENLYQLYQNDMSESEKFAAQTKIDELKSSREANANAYSSVIEQAVQNGATSEVLAKIDAAAAAPGATVASIYAAAGEFAVKPSDGKLQLESDGRGGFVLFDPNTGTVTPVGDVAGGAAGGINEDALALATNMASTGTMPSKTDLQYAGTTLGQVQELAKSLPKPDGALLDRNTGLKPTSLSAAQQDGITALAEIVQKTLPTMQEVYPKLVTGGGILYTSADRQKYETFKQEFLSKLLAARSGAAVTEQEYARYAAMMPGGLDQLTGRGVKKLDSLLTSMKQGLDNKLNTTQTGIVGYTKVKVQGDPSGSMYTVGDTLDINGMKARVNVDGSLTDLNPPDQSSFNSAGNASASISALGRSITQQESGGRYDAVGIETDHGRALGKYQIIPKFHFASIGLNPNSQVDQQRFLRSPALQDRLFNMILTDLHRTYKGDPRKVAAAYYGGSGAVAKLGTRAADVPQAGGMPSINSYVRSVVGRITA